MVNNDLVSIITPAYNAEKFIQDTIRSVQNQSYQNWEMIIVDDCSKDDTCTIVERMVKNDSRIYLVKHKINGGAAVARETALEAAKGRYIAFLDSDDLWMPEKLEHQLRFMEKVGAPLSYTCFRRISQNAETCGRLIKVPSHLTYKQLLGNTAIATSTAIIDRQKTGSFEITRTYYDDFALWLSLLKRGLIAYGLNEDLMRYRVVDKSLSRNKGRSSLKVWRAYRELEGLGRVAATWYFIHYVWNALMKYKDL